MDLEPHLSFGRVLQLLLALLTSHSSFCRPSTLAGGPTLVSVLLIRWAVCVWWQNCLMFYEMLTHDCMR